MQIKFTRKCVSPCDLWVNLSSGVEGGSGWLAQEQSGWANYEMCVCFCTEQLRWLCGAQLEHVAGQMALCWEHNKYWAPGKGPVIGWK